jgi:dinuclear metal center YbgI/SA1388 family protein
MKLNDLTQYLTKILQPERFNDYCPNGLQVEGRPILQKIATGVTASQALIEQAIERGADAVLVHHGYFWRGESSVLTGIKKQRIKTLLTHDVSLYAYHLPLDAHPVFGNNVMLGQQLALTITRWLDDKNMLAVCDFDQPIMLGELQKRIDIKLGRPSQLIGDADRFVNTIAWCTGAAQQYIEQAVQSNVDVFLSGEISEQTVHIARESNTAYIAAGHHATERYGIAALGRHLSEHLGILHEFIDVDNPV